MSLTQHDASTSDAVDALADLHTRTVDALAGFETMTAKAEPEFRPVAVRFKALHKRHAAELVILLAAHGRTPDEDGSFMATVNRAVVSLRAFFDEIDEDVMDQVRSGEKHVLESFDRALAADLPADQIQTIRNLRGELEALVASTRHLD